MINTNVFFDFNDFQVNWPDGIYGPEAKYHKLTHHESHLSRRFDGAKWYIKSSGEGYPSYMREVESASAGSTFDQKVGGLEAGALVFIDLDQDTHPTNYPTTPPSKRQRSSFFEFVQIYLPITFIRKHSIKI